MEKVKVNQTVADWIEEIRKRCVAKNEKEFFSIMFGVVNTYYDELYKHIDIVTLAKAIQYGYEVPYEFKVGDILFSHCTNRFIEITVNINRYEREISHSALLENIHDGWKYDLVCKAENREDLKQSGEV